MKREKTKMMTTAISWLFLLYFAVLAAERIHSIVLCGIDGFFSTPFDTYVNLLTILSLTGTVILLVGFNGGFWRSLAGAGQPHYTRLVITAGVLLLSGMVHTEHTVAPIQFVAYGMLILAMLLQTVTVVQTAGHPFMHWYSLVYLVAFSMAIPVMYRAGIPQARLFHVLEAVISVALVAAFVIMMQRVFAGQGQNLLYWIPFAVAAVGDAVLLWMRWQESVNSFVLIFVSLTAVLFAVGKILFRVIGEK